MHNLQEGQETLEWLKRGGILIEMDYIHNYNYYLYNLGASEGEE